MADITYNWTYIKTLQKKRTVNINMENCKLPRYPLHGKYIFSDRRGTYRSGNSVSPFTTLILTCNIGYNFISPNVTQFFCSINGKWTPKLGECTRIKLNAPFRTTVAPDRQSGFSNINVILFTAVAVLFVVALVVGILYQFKFKKEKELKKELKSAGLNRFHKGNLKRFNPDLGIDVQAELLPYNINYEFPSSKLTLGQQLGSGAFGIVIKAEASGIISNEEKTTVAVKMVKDSTDNNQMKELISELKIMLHLGLHLNVVNLLGACTQNITKRELLVIVEYCPFGNLYNYLLRSRRNYIDQIDTTTGNIDYSFGLEDLNDKPKVPNNTRAKQSSTNSDCSSNYHRDYKSIIRPLYTKDIISWAFQIARGMEYLASRKIVHGDLAARNILLAENNIVKICDFGLAKRMYKRTNYKKQKDYPLPIKWMAVESIRERTFSMQSDVWSYGIVLWEIFSLAQSPYPAMEADEKLYHKLKDGYKMESPPFAPKEMYNIMCDCWNLNPLLRPCFNKLAGTVGLMLEENIRQQYVDLNDPYFAMNTQRLNDGQDDYLMILSSPEYLKILGINEAGIKGYISVINIADSVSNNGDIPLEDLQ